MTPRMTGDPALFLSRRKLIGFGAMAAGTIAASSLLNPASAAIMAPANAPSGARRISFRNAHTGESFSGVYRIGNKYLPDAFDSINVVLRDFRSDELFPIDPRVIDIIYAVHRQTGSDQPYEVLSGYRCPKTNAGLRRASSGVAKNSLHMTGQAIDLRLPGFDTKGIRSLAVGLKAGGVGYYARSNFVHMDTGDVRSW